MPGKNILKGNLGSALLSDAERQIWENQIWDEALTCTRADSLADYLKLRKSTGRAPRRQSSWRSSSGCRKRSLPGRHTRTSWHAQELEDQAVLAKDTAVQTKVDVYMKAAAGEFANPGEALDLCEQMLKAVPLVFESGVTEAPQQVDALVDAVGVVRRNKVFKEMGADEDVRLRLWRLTEGIKIMPIGPPSSLACGPPRKAIRDSQGTVAEQKLVAFWLLQLRQFPAASPPFAIPRMRAWPYRPAVARTGQEDLACWPTRWTRSRRRAEYSRRRQEEALRAYARHLRQTALDRNDSSLQPAERVEVQNKLSAAETDRSESYNRRFPREKWCKLTDVASADELRDPIDQRRQWAMDPVGRSIHCDQRQGDTPVGVARHIGGQLWRAVCVPSDFRD